MSNGPTGPGGRALTTAGLVAVVGAIVLGILGMHGLSQHGAMPGHGAHQPVAAPVTTDPHASHSDATHMTAMTAMVTGDLSTASTADGSAVAATDSGRSVSDMAMLCAVMLLAAAVGLLVASRLRRLAHSTVLGLKPRLRAVRAHVSARLDTGPPAVWEFSVVRC